MIKTTLSIKNLRREGFVILVIGSAKLCSELIEAMSRSSIRSLEYLTVSV